MVTEVEFDDGLERLCRGALAETVGQCMASGGVFRLQGEQLGDRIVPSLWSAATVGWSTIADDRVCLQQCLAAGAVIGLSLGVGERRCSVRRTVFWHPNLRYITLLRRSQW